MNQQKRRLRRSLTFFVLAYVVLATCTFAAVMTGMDLFGQVGAWVFGGLYVVAWHIAMRMEERRP